MQCQKTFFLCLLYIYTFPIASFHFFGELTDLGSKLGLQRAQFWSWLTELDLYANSKSLIYNLEHLDLDYLDNLGHLHHIDNLDHLDHHVHLDHLEHLDCFESLDCPEEVRR